MPYGFNDDKSKYALQEIIDSLETMQATKTTAIALRGFGNNPTMTLRRQGNVVFACVPGVVHIPTANVTIKAGTIPIGYRPNADLVEGGGTMIVNHGVHGNCRWLIRSNGAVTFNATHTGLHEAYLGASWLTSDEMPA